MELMLVQRTHPMVHSKYWDGVFRNNQKLPLRWQILEIDIWSKIGQMLIYRSSNSNANNWIDYPETPFDLFHSNGTLKFNGIPESKSCNI